MNNKLQYKARNPNRTYDIGFLLTKKRNTIWDLLPTEICEIIYHYYIFLRQKMVKSYLPELTDNDIYTEMRYRNRKCFASFDLDRSEIYNNAMSNIGIFDTAGDGNTLIYNNDEIEYANEIVNMTIRANENLTDLIMRMDYYTINDVYDAINAHCAIYNTENTDTSGNIIAAITKWTSMNNREKLEFCVENFNKFKMDFVNTEHIVTNSYRFNVLRTCCEKSLHIYMGIE
tara:strand:+ start:56 stop:745 length:690 start_codon:yes stop_codon:yes gene_type:complete